MNGFLSRLFGKFGRRNRARTGKLRVAVRTSVHDISTFKIKRKWWLIATYMMGGYFVFPVIWGNIRNNRFIAEEKKKVNYDAVRADITKILDEPSYDDGSYGPVLIRLAWHASGTYDRVSGTGGSDGATMRFSPESNHGANAGLHVARARLEKIKEKYPELSYADLWTLAGVVAVEAMGGPQVSWRPGRSDKVDGKSGPPDGRLPDASKGVSHVREIFSRMGFSDQEMVALIGAHAVGRCHTDRSGYDGPWTQSPTVFSNDFYVQLLERKWTPRKWNGPKQFEDESKTLMMLPADIALIEDPAFKKWVEIYAKDEGKWHQDFANAFSKLLELGVKY